MTDPTDIVTWLRSILHNDRSVELRCQEAANEIEFLRNELDARIAMCDMRSEKIGELTNERDEARQEICESHCDSLAVVLGSHITPQDYAQRRGWDCFKKKTPKDCFKENTNV
jgi:hypothetical protein